MDPSLGLSLDARSGHPIHRQIFDQVAARIESRTFPAGFKLPPTRTLAVALGAHRNTVARAYADLMAAGFVFGAVGRGTFVGDGFASGGSTPVATPAPTASAAPLRWRDLLSRTARSELPSAAERYKRVADRGTVNLARLQPSRDLLPDELMRRCIGHVVGELGPDALTYAPPEGVLRAREAIAAELVSRGVPAVADDLLVTSGSQQGLDLVARALVSPGETVLVEDSTYSGAIDIFGVAGARLVSVPTDDEGVDVSALERLSRPDVKLLYLMPNGHNPTGRTMSLARRKAVVAWAKRASVPIVEDDYAAGLALEGSAEPHLRALDGDVIHRRRFARSSASSTWARRRSCNTPWPSSSNAATCGPT